MTPYEATQKILWFVPIGIEFLTVIVLVKRRLHRELPIFTVYLSFVCGHDLVLSALYGRHPTAYFYSYWLGEVVTAILGYAVLYEIFNAVLKPYESVQRIGKLLFGWALVLLVAVAIVTAGVASGGEAEPWMAAILAAERAVRIVQVGLALFLFMFASSLGLTWRHFVFGIATGFGLYACAELVVVAMRSYFGHIGDSSFVLLKPAAMSCAVFVWASYLFRDEPVKVAPRNVPDHYDIVAWNRVLSEYLHR
jgi:hypothetical protein